MSGEQRRRLATAAADSGYPGSLLAAIAQATLPKYAAGQSLEERHLGEVGDAVELLAEASLGAGQVDALIADCRKLAPERWRELFWTVVVKAACANAHRTRANVRSNQAS